MTRLSLALVALLLLCGVCSHSAALSFDPG